MPNEPTLDKRFLSQSLDKFLGQSIYVLYLELLSSMNYEPSRIYIFELTQLMVSFLMTHKLTRHRSLPILNKVLLIFMVTSLELIV